MFSSGLHLEERRVGTNRLGKTQVLRNLHIFSEPRFSDVAFWKYEVWILLLISSWAKKRTAETQANCFQSISRPCLREKKKKSKDCHLESFSQELYWKYTPTHIHCVYPSGLYLNSLVCISTRKANQSDGKVRNLHFLRKKKRICTTLGLLLTISTEPLLSTYYG